MEVVNVAKRIEDKIHLLEQGRSQLQELAHAKAQTLADYEKQLAITLLRLKNGQELALDGHKARGLAATYMEKVARGMCWQERLAADEAEANYKLTVSKMESVKAELNGYQSIFRHLDET